MHDTSRLSFFFVFFFFNDTATTEIYTLSLHDALPIWSTSTSQRTRARCPGCALIQCRCACQAQRKRSRAGRWRSEEHTSELQSQSNLVCRLLLEKKKKIIRNDGSTKANRIRKASESDT